jgi:hypothetical protein
VKRFDFSRAQLAADVDWCPLFLDLGIDDCVEKLYISLFVECFESFVPFYYSVNLENRQPWFDEELRNLDKSHKYMKKLAKIYIRPMTELQQCKYDATSERFHDLKYAYC